MLTRFRNLSYLMAYTVATIPLWHYIRDERIILLMTMVVLFAYSNVVLSSVDAAQAILSSEKTKILLPRWLPKSPKYQKWWAIVHHTLRWHLFLIPAKIGLALAFVEWLHAGARFTTRTLLKPYFYQSSPMYLLHPQWETFLLGFMVIIIFTLLESGLIAALSILTRNLSHLLVLRLLIALSIMGILSQYQLTLDYYPFRCRSQCAEMQRNARIVETIETSLLTLDDMGVLLAANIMRPVGRNNTFAQQYFSDFGHRDINFLGKPDNRLFVARQLVAGLLGILAYLLTIGGALWFVRDSETSEY